MTDLLQNPRWGPASGGAIRQLVVLLHGVGADGFDLIDLAPGWGAALPDALFLAPHAPEAFDMAPQGRQWFSLEDRNPDRMLAGVESAAAWLQPRLAESLAILGLARRDMALMGFSQGAMLALQAGLFHPERCAGVLAYSGALLGAARLDAAPRPAPPILLVHGEADEVVPVSASRQAEQALRAQGIAVEVAYRPRLGHGIDDHGIALGASALRASLESQA